MTMILDIQELFSNFRSRRNIAAHRQTEYIKYFVFWLSFLLLLNNSCGIKDLFQACFPSYLQSYFHKFCKIKITLSESTTVKWICQPFFFFLFSWYFFSMNKI